MESKLKNRLLCNIMLVYLIVICVIFFVRKPDKYSYSERRVLEQRPVFTLEKFIDGDYGDKYETFLLEQIPLRDDLRTLKAIFEKCVFARNDYNGIVFKKGHFSKIEYPMNESILDNTFNVFEKIYNKYLKNNGIQPYKVIIPDKNYFLSDSILTLDYDKLYSYIEDKTPYMKNIDIRPYLNLKDFYCSDTHWRQEKIKDIAMVIANELGVNIDTSYEKVVVKEPFYGVFANQVAFPKAKDKFIYLTNDNLKKCIVKCYDTGNGVKKEVYDRKKLKSRYAYDFFLAGSAALLTVENPKASSSKELVMFRDSFSSSLAPYLVEGYKKITLVDIRYMQSDMVGNFIEFNNQDVLFIYSTMLLNNNTSLR